MDHELVVRDKMTERYLLDELDAGERDQFEEHYFSCPDCALDVRAGAEMLAQSKVLLSETPEAAFTHVVAPRPKPEPAWLNWLSPAFAVPVMATLLLVIGYQNLVTYPKLQSQLHTAQVLPWTSVNIRALGEEEPTITASQGQGLLLFVRIPPDSGYTRYTADLYNPEGKVDSSLAIPASTQQDQWPVQIPAANRAAGRYTLQVHGVTPTGTIKEVGKASFELQLQK